LLRIDWAIPAARACHLQRVGHEAGAHVSTLLKSA
jgi:hypothetical protein